ncbi:transposase [Streptomyces sp. CBMA123]|uniref:transposase n=1 Tax=Streptomyces sp. CBMA123 TaxID=1896313 RepID=UPI001661910A|nr:transposase [Streptomyces sp. CBMA123]
MGPRKNTGGSDVVASVAELAAEQARAGGMRLLGEGGLLQQLTRHLLQEALEAEMDEHLASTAEPGRSARKGGNARNGYRMKTVMTEAGPVTLEVPRDRAGTFEPKAVPRHARRTEGLDNLVVSLTAKGLTSGEIVAHLAEVYGMTTSKETVSTITDRVLEGMAERRTRPLDPVYPVLFVDAVDIKVRDGQVANRRQGRGLAGWTTGCSRRFNESGGGQLLAGQCGRDPRTHQHPTALSNDAGVS